MRDDLVCALEEYLADAKGKAFDFHEMDCVRFAAGWFQRIKGHSPIAGLEWSDEAEARALVARLNENGIAGLVDQHLDRIAVSAANFGDIMAIAGTAQELLWTPLGICLGRSSAFFVEKHGLIRLRTLSAVHAWSLGV